MLWKTPKTETRCFWSELDIVVNLPSAHISWANVLTGNSVCVKSVFEVRGLVELLGRDIDLDTVKENEKKIRKRITITNNND